MGEDWVVLIDELVVQGTRPDRAAVAAAACEELERLAGSGGLDGGVLGRDIVSIDIDDRHASAAELGRAIALAVHRGLR